MMTVNVGDVATDPRYLTAFGTTRSEIIVPVYDESRSAVIGTIDVESEKPHAFSDRDQVFLEECSELLTPLWSCR
jgi:putative methionine-R-sulfoxide reductase with GAF domain